jgi:hypothetical protein
MQSAHETGLGQPGRSATATAEATGTSPASSEPPRSAKKPGHIEVCGLPDTRSPYDPWHTEGYLIRCLVHLHGWAHLEAGVLRRMKRG